jgi:hypothetical protein
MVTGKKSTKRTPRRLNAHPWRYRDDAVAKGRSTSAEIGAFVLTWYRAAKVHRRRVLGRGKSIDRLLESHFYAIALKDLEAICRLAGEKLGSSSIKRALSRYRSRVPAASHIRDIHEHIDAYLTGSGKLQKRAAKKGQPWGYSWTRALSYDTVSGLKNYVIEIAGKYKLDVQDSFEAATELANTTMIELENATI